MTKEAYHECPADKIGYILCYMAPNGWEWDIGPTRRPEPSGIQAYYVTATSRDYDGDTPVFHLRETADRRYVSITSKNLLKANNHNPEINPFESLKQKVIA